MAMRISIALFYILYVGTVYSQAAVQRSTTKVYKRYYFVNRLQKTISILAKIKDTSSHLHELIYNKNHEFSVMGLSFTHEQVVSSLEKVARTKSLKPLFMVWGDFARYKSLEDELFVVDFTKEIFVITKSVLMYRALIGHAPRRSVGLFAELEMLIPHNLELLVDLVDSMSDCIFCTKKDECDAWNNFAQALYKCLESQRNFTDISHHIETDQVCLRRYYTERLRSGVKSVKRARKHFSLTSKKGNNTFDENIIFTHPQVIQAVRRIERSGKIEPLIFLWKDVKQFKYISNKQFVKEICIAFFIAQKNIAVNLIQNNPKTRVPIAEIIALYQAIDSLPIEGILSAIDLVSTVVVELSDKDKKDKENKKWGKVFKKYWWIQPIIILSTLSWKVVSHYDLLGKLKNYLDD